MIIQATEQQVDLIVPLGNQFSDSSKFVRFDTEIAVKNIKSIISNKIGVLFLYIKNDDILGMICGIKHPDILTGKWVATELFWFVDVEHRGIGLKLLNQFEKWAMLQGCTQIIMMHLSDLMPEIVKKIYIKRGYELLESHFIKEL